MTATASKKYVSGFCSEGSHEGTRPKSFKGTPMKTCPHWQTCSCDCHVRVTEVFEATGATRVEVVNPDYVPYKSQFSLERQTVQAPSLLDTSTKIAADVLVSVAPGIVPGATVKVFPNTPSGRFARGELEYLVKAVTDTWVIEGHRFHCTPAYIAAQIGEAQGIVPPALGGINAVFIRWEERGFAVTDKLPTRFVRYTEAAIRLGLDGIDEKFKRDRKFSKLLR